MSLEPLTIIHFTKSAAALKGILSDGFKIKYCKEGIWFKDVEKKFRIPMVSFCDIPIAQAKDHMEKYGNYALGLTEEWANGKGLTPVTYLQRHSPRAESMLNALNLGIDATKKNPNDKPLMDVLQVLRFTKNFKGEVRRSNGEIIPEYYFGDESEWRYSPDTGHFHKFIFPEEAFKDKEMADMVQKLIDDERLSFTAKDVRYIIIEKEEGRAGFESHIRSLPKQFTEEEREGLITKIRTAEQIKEESDCQKSS